MGISQQQQARGAEHRACKTRTCHTRRACTHRVAHHITGLASTSEGTRDTCISHTQAEQQRGLGGPHPDRQSLHAAARVDCALLRAPAWSSSVNFFALLIGCARIDHPAPSPPPACAFEVWPALAQHGVSSSPAAGASLPATVLGRGQLVGIKGHANGSSAPTNSQTKKSNPSVM